MSQHKRTIKMLSTQMAVVLTLNIQVQDDNDSRSLIIPLLVLTGILYRLWLVKRTTERYRFEFTMFIRDIQEAVRFTSKLFSISLKSLAFGFGVVI